MRYTILMMTAFLGLASTAACAQEFTIPKDYPPTYGAIIAAAKSESPLIVYSSISAINWKPFIKLVAERFPWMKVNTTDENSPFEKYLAESSAKVRTADLIATAQPDRWADFADRGEVLSYASPEDRNLPAWSRPLPGVYTASADPFIFSYNKRAFANSSTPKSVADVVAAFQKNPALKGRIGTYSPEVALGLAVWKAWVAKHKNGWDMIKVLGPAFRREQNAGTMREKVSTGEYALAIFTSGASISQYEQPAVKALAGWEYPTDGTPVVERNMAITKAAASPNSAKLFMDLMLSHDGQIALGQGGLAPYRADIAATDVPFASYAAILRDVGEGNIIRIGPDKSLLDGSDSFMKQWNEALGKP